jgi:hypothetical protein
MSNKIACLVGETIHSKSQTKTATRLKRTPFQEYASTYEIDQNFSFMARIGMDNSNDFRWSRRPVDLLDMPKECTANKLLHLQNTMLICC